MAKGVLVAIEKVQAYFAEKGIPKGQRNTQQNYAFRGIDDVYMALAPQLAAAHLLITPSVVEFTTSEHESKSGGTLFKTAATVEYTFETTIDDSSKIVRVVGEAMDSGDKGMNKAMSAAYKVMAIQTFCIPTGDASDIENQSHEVTGRSYTPPQQQRRQPAADTPPCIACGSVTSVMKSKYHANGYYCNPKSNGCGAKFNSMGEDLTASTGDSYQ